MNRIELTLTDTLGISGTVLAKHEDGSLWDFDILSWDAADCDEPFSPTWKQVERELESELYPDNSPVMMKDFY